MLLFLTLQIKKQELSAEAGDAFNRAEAKPDYRGGDLQTFFSFCKEAPIIVKHVLSDIFWKGGGEMLEVSFSHQLNISQMVKKLEFPDIQLEEHPKEKVGVVVLYHISCRWIK